MFVFRHPGASWWHARWPAANPIEIHHSHMWMGLAGIGLAALLIVALRRGLALEERRTMRAMLVGGGLGLLPISVAPAHSRLLIVAQLGACVVIALLAFACGRMLLGRPAAGEHEQEPRRSDRLRAALALPGVLAMLWLNLVVDLRWTRVYLAHMDGMQASNVAAFTQGDLLNQKLDGRDVIVINGPSQTTAMYGPFVLHANGAAYPASWRALALGGAHAIWIQRMDDHTLELAAINGAWLRTAGELFFRRLDQHLPAGSSFDYPSLDVEVLEDIEGDPTRLRFRFAHSLDDPRYLFLVSTNQGLMRWEVPKVHGSDVVPIPRMPYVGTRDTLAELRTRGPK